MTAVSLLVAFALVNLVCAAYFWQQAAFYRAENRRIRLAMKRSGYTVVVVAGESISEGDFVRVRDGQAKRFREAA
jgi:hypothetical protein